MFGKALNPSLHEFFWSKISVFPYSSPVAKIFDLGETFHITIKKNIVLLVVLFFCNHIFVSLLQGSAITWQKYLKISFIKIFIWFIGLSVKFFNNAW